MQVENTKAFPCFVADASFMVAYLLNGLYSDEFSSCVKDVENVILNNGQLYVPQLFWYEIYNAILSKTRRSSGGLSKADAMDILYDLQKLPIYTEPQPDAQIRSRIFDLAEEFGLSFYAASYLELARRNGLELKTYDEELKKARQ